MKKFGVDYALLDPVHIVEDSECCLVVPAVIAREGVFPYPEGKAFKPADELREAAWTADAAWLVPEEHPWTGVLMDRDQIIGRVEKPRFSKNGIKTHLRFYKSKTTPSFLNDVKSGRRKGVSIGFFYEYDASPGEWNDKPYDFVQRNILIDHVAVGVPKARCAPPLCGIGIDSTFKAAVDALQVAVDPEETEDHIHIPVEDSSKFVGNSFRTIDIDPDRGIQAVIGKYKSDPDGATHVQKYVFDKSKDWTLEKAEAWVQEHREATDQEEEEGELEKKRAAAKERCGKYPVSLKEDGHLTKPGEYENLQESQFADPCNYRYPIDEEHVMAAWSYINQEKNRVKGGYSEAEWTWMKNRVKKAMKAHGHELQEEKEKAASDVESEVDRSIRLLQHFK